MASKQQVENLTAETICSICLDFFTNPVILECGHNFCRSCVIQFWESAGRNSCPECRVEFRGNTLRINRVLASLAKKAQVLSLHLKEKESKRRCEEHQEELKLFCETDKKLICVVCAVAREHKSHDFMLVKVAAEIYKDQVRSSLESLTEKKSTIQNMEQEQEEKIFRVLEQSRSLQYQITSQFAELQQIIMQKEQRLLRDLREEEEMILSPMDKNLRAIQGNLNSIQDELSKLQERMDQRDNVVFLKEEACRDKRVSGEHHKLIILDGTLAVEKFDHPFLLNAAVKEALDFIKPFSVTLDVETAHPRLEVSEDRKSVRGTATQRDLPDTGKRFTVRDCVLGSEGFTSGRHYWEVEVAGNRGWRLGVAEESVERKKKRFALVPESGFWTIERAGDAIYVNTSPKSRLPAGPVPGRVGVYLNYETGTVSFYSADTKSHLQTFTGNKFTEKLYPFFWTVHVNWLIICSGSDPNL